MPAATSVSDARSNFAEIFNRAAYAKERTVVERHGKKAIAIVPYEDLELLEKIEDLLDIRAALAALREAEEQGTVSWDELKRERAR